MNQFFLRKMTRGLIIGIVIIFAIVIFSSPRVEASEFFGVRRNIATIIFCGLGGAVLGISTLSFYNDPQNHIGNITTGLALGIVGGAATVLTRDSQPLDPIAEFRYHNSYHNNHSLFSYKWTF